MGQRVGWVSRTGRPRCSDDGHAVHFGEGLVYADEAEVAVEEAESDGGVGEDGIEEGEGLGGGFLEACACGFDLVALDGDAGDVRGSFDDGDFFFCGRVRCGRKHGEGAEHFADARPDGLGPAGAKAMLEGEGFALFPEWVGLDVLDDDAFPAKGRSATGAAGGANRNTVADGVAIGGRKAGGGADVECAFVVAEDEGGAGHVGDLLFECGDEGGEYFFEWAAGGEELEGVVLSEAELFVAAAAGDVGEDADPSFVEAVGVADGGGGEKGPDDGAVFSDERELMFGARTRWRSFASSLITSVRNSSVTNSVGCRPIISSGV